MGSPRSHVSIDSAARLLGAASLTDILPLSLQRDPRVERSTIVVRECRDENGQPLIAESSLPSGIPSTSGRIFARLAISYGVLTKDTRQMALTGDQTVAAAIDAVRTLESSNAPGKIELTVPEFEARGLRLADLIKESPGILGTLTTLFGPEPTLRWGICTSYGLSGARSMPGAGWWSATLAPSGCEAANQAAIALSAEHGGLARPRLSIGVVRPRLLLRAIGARSEDVGPALPSLEWIDEIAWDAWLRPDKSLQCDVSIRIAR
jgi:hypothetical protein